MGNVRGEVLLLAELGNLGYGPTWKQKVKTGLLEA